MHAINRTPLLGRVAHAPQFLLWSVQGILFLGRQRVHENTWVYIKRSPGASSPRPAFLGLLLSWMNRSKDYYCRRHDSIAEDVKAQLFEGVRLFAGGLCSHAPPVG